LKNFCFPEPQAHPQLFVPNGRRSPSGGRGPARFPSSPSGMPFFLANVIFSRCFIEKKSKSSLLFSLQ
jgi:hypothetical protein